MTRSIKNIRLKPEKTINPTSSSISYTGKLGKNNLDDIYRFKLSDHSSLSIKLDGGLGAKTNLELVQDRNLNEYLDPGEIVARSRSIRSKGGAVTLSDVSPGTYFLRVSMQQGGRQVNYSLTSVVNPLTPAPSSTTAPQSPPSTGNPLIDQVVQLTNNFRVQNGLQPLSYNLKLASSAQAHSQSMALQDFFGHTSKDGLSPFDRIRAAGYQYSAAAENIAAGYTTAERVVEGWINSPGHRANMLNPNLKEIGVGYYYLASDTGNVSYYHYWTQNFGTGL
jgi:uncharacterized protein YkwD